MTVIGDKCITALEILISPVGIHRKLMQEMVTILFSSKPQIKVETKKLLVQI